MHNEFHDPAAYRKKYLGYRANQKCADNGSDIQGSPKQKSHSHKAHVCTNTGGAKRKVQLITDNNRHQVIGAYTRVRFHHYGHAKGQDHTACSQSYNPDNKGIA